MESDVRVTGVPRLQLALERYQLRLLQARVGARVLAHMLRGLREPRIGDDRDFGNFRDKGEQRVRVAANAEEAQRILAEAYASGTPVNVGASRHSSNGHTLSRGGVRLLLDGTTWGEPQLLPDDRVDAPGPGRWGALETFLNTHRRACPVLTDYLHTTIGGTLSVGGGIGTRSLVGGRQLDSVERIRLLLADGSATWISHREEPDLFRYVMGGQGVLGIIDRVVTRTVPHRPYVAQLKLQLRSLREAAAVVHAFLGGVHGEHPPSSLSHLDIMGPILDTPVVEVTFGFEYESRREAQAFVRHLPEGLESMASRVFDRGVVKNVATSNHMRSAAYIAMLTAPADPHAFLWNDFFFPCYEPYDRFLRYAEEVMAKVGNRYLMTALGLAYPIAAAEPTFPLAGLVREEGRRPFSIGFNYAVPLRDRDAGDAIRRVLDDFQRVAPTFGGRMYRYGYSQADARSLRELYGADYERLLELRRRVDPKELLNPDVLR